MAAVANALSAKVIVHDAQGKVLLLQRSASSTNHAGKWEFPGGKVNPGESFQDALLRKVREETGLEIELRGSFGVCEARRVCPPVVYLVMEGEARSTVVRLSGEHDAYAWVAPGDLEQTPIRPQFRRIARRYAQEASLEPRRRSPEPLPQPGEQEPQQEDLHGSSVVRPDTLQRDIESFLRAREQQYLGLKNWLHEFLGQHVRAQFPLAEVGARAKDPVSFAGKLIKKNKYKHPLRDMTDLVGARIVVHLPSEVDDVCRWIEDTFEIDRANSGDKLQDLGAEKFGYRSVHYVVELQPDRPRNLPESLVGLKAEIQVRTIAQHAWSDIGHDRVYKADCEIPAYWKREANRIAALLEAADDAFARLSQGVAAFQDHARQSPDGKSARRQIELWDVVRHNLPSHPRPALQVARLAMEIEDWHRIVQVVDAYQGPPHIPLLCAKGYALCKLAEHVHTPQWMQGVQCLEQAASLGPAVLEPHLRLGELWAPHNPNKALEHFQRAFAIDPSNPAALAGYIRCNVLVVHTTSFIPLLRPNIEQAITRSEELAAAGANLPHALYRIAGLHLLLGESHSYQSLDLFARAVHQTWMAPDPLLQALRDVSQLARYASHSGYIECARRFLAAALQARFPQQPWPQDLEKPAAVPLTSAGPVVIIAGGCDAYHDAAMRSYGDLLSAAFADFHGTVISGGTREGISGVVGDLAAKSGGRIRPVGYLPASLPTDNSATRDERYVLLGEIRRTDGAAEESFTARQPIQNWLDLMAAGISPRQVRLLGINGGNVAGLEYRLAVALGATVGIIEGSGREAERVVNDWPSRLPFPSDATAPQAGQLPPPGRLVPLPADRATLRAFLFVGESPAELPAEAVEVAAKQIHQDFLEQQRYSHPDPIMQPWPKLRGDLRNSNRSQVEYLVSILAENGFGVRTYSNSPGDPEFTDDEVKAMGELEHGRWNMERLHSGWRYAPVKDSRRRLSPYIVPWKELAQETRHWDFLNVRLWPEILAEAGYEIYRLTEPKPAPGS